MKQLALACLIAPVLVLSTSFANDNKPVPTQTEIAKNGAKAYFSNLVDNGYENLLGLAGLNDFPFFENMHKENPARSAFRMFNANKHRNKPSQEFSFPFYNSSEDVADVIKSEFGLCAGFSTTLRKFNMLAYYDLENTEKQKVPAEGSDAWFKFYKGKIDEIVANKMTIIPGFSNLYEFSSHPLIQTYIKQIIVRQWQVTNLNIMQGVLGGIMSVKNKPTLAKLQNTRDYLAQRVSYGINPIVYLSKYNENFLNKEQYYSLLKDSWKTAEISQKTVTVSNNVKLKFTTDLSTLWIHVLMIYEVSPLAKDGSYTIKAWDINDDARLATKIITVDSKGVVKMNYDYEVKGDQIRLGQHIMANDESLLQQLKEAEAVLADIVPLKWDDLEMERIIKANFDFCSKYVCTKPQP